MRKGLAGLFGLRNENDENKQADKENYNKLIELDINEIRVSPYQARTVFSTEELSELTESIKEFGILQPILVRRVNTRYELVAGERRLRAAKKAGLIKITAILCDMNDSDTALASLSENIQRRNLNYLEEAYGYRAVIDRFGLSQSQLAQHLGVSQSLINSRLSLLKLGDEILGNIDIDKVNEGHLEALLQLDDDEQRKLVLDEIYKKNLSVKQTKNLVQKILKLKDTAKQRIVKVLGDTRLYYNSIKKVVKDMEDAGLEIEYGQDISDEWIDIHIRMRNAGSKPE